MDLVVTLGETLSMILAQAELGTCTVAMRVSRLWYEPAANEIWRDLPNLLPLFRLLAPMELEENQYVFTSTFGIEDWDRLCQYSPRVRSLQFNNKEPNISPHVMAQIAMTRPVLFILPLLSRLDLGLHRQRLYVNESVLFFSPELTTLNVVGSGSSYLAAVPFVRDIRRLRNLEHLSLKIVPETEEGVDAIIEVIRTLSILRTVHFELSAHGIFAIFDAIGQSATIPSISVMQFPEEELFAPALSQSERPAACNYTQTKKLRLADMELVLLDHLLRRYDFQTLEYLHLEFDDSDTAHVNPCCEDLFLLVTSTCPNVQTFKLSSRVAIANATPLDLDTLAPILTLRHLRNLHINFALYPLRLSHTDMCKIAEALGHSIEVLDLHASPARSNESSLEPSLIDLSVLAAFCQHCPKLRVLSIFVDATFIPTNLPPQSTKFPPNLRQIQFGTSPMKSPVRIATFLRRFVTPAFRKYGTFSGTQNEASWRMVEDVVKLLCDEVEPLEKEVERLSQQISEAVVERANKLNSAAS